MRVWFDLGSSHTSYAVTTPGVWQAGDKVRVSGATNFVSTNGATLYITGVQLEKGPIATPFEARPFSVELQMCQRYYEIFTGYSAIHQAAGLYDSTIAFKVNKRKSNNSITLVGGNGALTWRSGNGTNLSCSIIGNYITNVVVRTSDAIVGGSLGGDVYIDSEL